MRNVKTILVLLLFGLALIIVGATRMSLGDSGGAASAEASPVASWITGLVGLALVAAGATMLGKRAGEARARAAGRPATGSLRPSQTIAIVGGAIAAVAVVAIGSSMLRSHASSPSAPAPTESRAPVARDGGAPAPAPMPTPYSPK